MYTHILYQQYWKIYPASSDKKTLASLEKSFLFNQPGNCPPKIASKEEECTTKMTRLTQVHHHCLSWSARKMANTAGILGRHLPIWPQICDSNFSPAYSPWLHDVPTSTPHLFKMEDKHMKTGHEATTPQLMDMQCNTLTSGGLPQHTSGEHSVL